MIKPAFPLAPWTEKMLGYKVLSHSMRYIPWLVAFISATAMNYFLFFMTMALFSGHEEVAVSWVASVGIGLGYAWLLHEPAVFLLFACVSGVLSHRVRRPARVRVAQKTGSHRAMLALKSWSFLEKRGK